ncbi:MAG: MotE family protein [Desulfuromonadaceae bacterium]
MNIRTLAFSCSLALSLVAVTTSVTAQNAENGNKGISSVEERRLLAEFKENRQQLNERNQELQKRELELNILQDEVDKKLEQLEQLRLQLEEMLADKDVQEQERINQLSQMYNRMDPARAANVFLELDTELVVGILGGMKARSAGAVLENMEGEKAARISKAYSTLKED